MYIIKNSILNICIRNTYRVDLLFCNT
jgi:hypothetical protein